MQRARRNNVSLPPRYNFFVLDNTSSEHSFSIHDSLLKKGILSIRYSIYEYTFFKSIFTNSRHEQLSVGGIELCRFTAYS